MRRAASASPPAALAPGGASHKAGYVRRCCIPRWSVHIKRMKVRAILVGGMAVWLTAACSIEDQATDGDSADRTGQDARVKDRVLAVVCDPDSRSTPEKLVPLVSEVRARDGRSDRVWEVADGAECIAGPTKAEPASTD